MIYDFILTLTGINIYFITLAFGGGFFLAVLCAVLFFLLMLTPGATISVYNSEGLVNFFATLGLLIALLGVDSGCLWLHVVGCVVAGLGFYVKVTTFDHLWPLVMTFFRTDDLQYLVASLVVPLLLYVGYLLLVWLNSEEGLSNSLFRGARFHLNNAANQKKAFQGAAMVERLLQNFYDSMKFLLPFVMLFIAYLIYAPDDAIKSTMLLLFLLSSMQNILRVTCSVQYGVLTLFPVAYGSSWVIQQSFPWIIDHPVYTLFGVLIVFIFCYKSFKDLTSLSIYKWRSSTVSIKSQVIDYLKKNIAKDDYIYQNSYYTFLYYELNCKGPTPEFLWANYIRYMALDNEKLRRMHTSYFVERQPKYLVVEPVYPFDLDVLEKAYGLRYQLVRKRGNLIYKLVGSSEPKDTDGFDPRTIYSPNHERFERDGQELAKRSQVLLQRGLQWVNKGELERALPYLRDSWDASAPLADVGIVLAQSLDRTGDRAAAVAVLSECALLFPDSAARQQLTTLTSRDDQQGGVLSRLLPSFVRQGLQ